MACLGLAFISVFNVKDMKLYVSTFSFCSITWKVYPSKIRFSGNGEKTEFPRVENSWFSHEYSSPKPNGEVSNFIIFTFIIFINLN